MNIFASRKSNTSARDNTRIGTVKFFSRAKGWGFISADDGVGQDVFVHHTAIQSDAAYKNLYEGDRVRYRLVDVGRGPQAQDVRVVADANGHEVSR